MSDRELGHALLRHARAAIAARLGTSAPSTPGHDALARHGATFVTLMRNGQLRGCIGTLEAFRELAIDVRENAVAAAFRDPRFLPLQRAEFETTSVEVSLLGPSEPVPVADEDDLLARLRPGVDGVILEHGGRRATFLPQVWESLADPREFVAALKRKAGLPADFWSSRLNVRRYEVLKWKESEFRESEEAR
jgi:AmmeMemoRadiSam system protein A